MLAPRRSGWVPAATPKTLRVPWSVLPNVTAHPRREQIDLEHSRRGRPQLLRHPVTSLTGPRPRGAPRGGRRGRADVHDEDRTLMLRLSRGFGPVSGCRWFNAVQIRGQGRALHVFFLRAFGADRRLVRWIFNSPLRSFKQRVLVDRQ